MGGATGDRGEKGEKGATGNRGEKGATGNRGDVGSKGATGNRGEQGLHGNDGMGLKYVQFKLHDTYTRGNYVFSRSSESSTHDSMYIVKADSVVANKLPYEDLDSGNWVEFKAPQGEKGGTGNKGEKGAQGATGNKGEVGGTGAKGEKGNDGTGL